MDGQCEDNACPIVPLFEHPAFMRAFIELTAEEKWPTDRISEWVLALLEASPLTVTDDLRARVNSSSDPDQLRVWASRALSVSSPEELFADGRT
ncbi:hypothetical protein ACIQMV_27030 [Streptomyces sp. NPDC091412]|uniref:hypothetical protein n=1 Tax=Streptomyces sp. NPDC091412 TaxID=3366002 RepID=UPI003822B5A5